MADILCVGQLQPCVSHMASGAHQDSNRSEIAVAPRRPLVVGEVVLGAVVVQETEVVVAGGEVDECQPVPVSPPAGDRGGQFPSIEVSCLHPQMGSGGAAGGLRPQMDNTPEAVAAEASGYSAAVYVD
ncbi:MAG: hypothetical protein VX670_11040, partial [Candidatus Latescibacterota bacterium]|nr:hypothetical protein [Candidatus Latescibacterota bacterium]